MEKKSLKIKEDDKFFNRLMSKDLALSSSSNTSSRHYYVGASGAVPFTWESQPGTPKHVMFSDNSSLIPPLTPPPSYNPKSSLQMMNNMEKKSKISWLTSFILLSWKTMKSSSSSDVSPSPTLSNTASSSNFSPSSSRSSSWSSSSIKSKSHHHCHRQRYRCFSSRSGDHVHDCNEEEEVHDQRIGSASGLSPNSTLCFGVINKTRRRLF